MTRATRMVEYKGQQMTLSEAVRSSGTSVSYHTVAARLDGGWPLLRALGMPAASPKRFDSLRPLTRGESR